MRISGVVILEPDEAERSACAAAAVDRSDLAHP